MTTALPFGDPVEFRAQMLDEADDVVLTANVEVYFSRLDNQFWNGTTWQAARVALTTLEGVTKISDTNHPGVWQFIFDSNNGNASDTYFAEFVDTTGQSRRVPIGAQDVGGADDTTRSDIKRVLGLNHEFFVLEQVTSNIVGQLATGNVYLYDNETNTDNDGRTIATGLIAKYDITATYNAVTGVLEKMSQKSVAIS